MKLIKLLYNVCGLLPSANEVCEGYVFHACLSFCPRGGGSSPLHAGIHTHPLPLGPEADTPPPGRGRYTPWGRHTPGPEAGVPPRTRGRYPPEQTPPQTRGRYPPLGPEVGTPWCSACWEIRATSGRYASYWNAILFLQHILCGKRRT